jgi:hypothetical protein
VSRSRLTSVLDWLALGSLILALTIYLAGGFTFRFGGVRATARTPHRALLVAVALISLRYALDQRTRPLDNAPALWHWVRDRLYDPHADLTNPERGGSAVRRRLLAAGGFAAFVPLLLHQQLRHMDSVSDLGDPLFSIWRIGWVYHQLTGGPGALFDANIFYPEPLALAYSDSMLLPAFTVAPFLALGIHPVTSYNVVLVASFWASAFAAFLLVDHLTGSARAAFVSGLLFGFYPYRFEQYNHFELLMTYCMPLCLLALHRFVATCRMREGLLAATWAAAQLYSAMYYAVFLMWYAGTVFAAQCFLTRPPIQRLAGPALISCVLALLLAAPLVATYRAAGLGPRGVHEATVYSATVADYLRPHPSSAMWGRQAVVGQKGERALFPGVMALVLAAIALIPPLGVTRVVYTIALLVIFEISRGYNGVIYPSLYDWLPFMRGLRVPARSGILVGLTLAILAGFGVRRVLQGRSVWLARGLLVAMIAAIAVDVRPALTLERVWSQPPPIYGSIGTSAVLAEFPLGGSPGAWLLTDTAQMYFSLWHWASLINGYSGHLPATYDAFQNAMRDFPDASTIQELRVHGATHVTVNCALFRSGCPELLEKVDALPDFQLLVSAEWQRWPVRLYALKPAQ